MMKSTLSKAVLSVLCVGTLAACTVPDTTEVEAPPEMPETEVETPASAMETAIVLPDGTECLHAGRGATLAFEGKRLNYTCGDTIGLIGDITIANGSELTLEMATIDGTTITGSETMVLMVESVDLADGTVCLNAGQGATLAFDDNRLNFTCGDDNTTGLIGDITQEDGVFIAEMATLDGTSLVSTEIMPVATLTTTMP
jgi:hypothetical protein